YALNYKMPHVLTLHGIPELDAKFTPGKANRLRSFILSKIEGFCRHRVKNLIIISKYLNDYLAAQITGHQWIIENPVSNTFFDATHSPQQNIFYAGMISKRKNILGLLQVFKLVHDRCPMARLLIAGPASDPNYVAQCEAYISENKLTDAVSFLGSLSPSEIKNILEISACLVLLSFQETAPLIIGEAMAVGVPVVASNIGGIPYMIENSITGYVVPPNDIVQTADRLLDIYENKELARSMGEKAQQSAQARYHIDTITDKTLAVYEEIKSNWIP
ncbi:MAG: glycosyltransferase family 4 protein, partial [Chlorobium sp.]|nr:glycosyltransferase family 4 protein [Chlorobium sp.]